MKKGLISLLVIVLLVVIVGGSMIGSYNKIVKMEEEVSAAWSQVENVYQRRADLIPNLVNTVKGYASHERETLEAVINARAKATQTTIDPTKLDAASLQQFQANQSELSSALGRLMVVMEQYPDLKANQNFRDLQVQLEGTENRIAVERRAFNDTAKMFNSYIRQFPKNIIAAIFNFEKKAYFEAEQGAEKAPEVSFE
ncbi:MAG TPA: LemA family protein [Prolixibacteraceae bacterium]|nr:LemA family protein [Prolixibacteraceae bacterium]HQN94512.1 LemA family protein [Prolixibacteraceae bacterium]HUM88616.1 LemA family protein [Prolixibacteraceae bacterium]